MDVNTPCGISVIFNIRAIAFFQHDMPLSLMFSVSPEWMLKNIIKYKVN